MTALKIKKNFIQNHKPELESLDLCAKLGLISSEEKSLACHLKWLYTVNYGLPNLQAYNPNKIKGFIPSKYQDSEFCEIRLEYKLLIEFLYQQDRIAAKFLINLVVFNYKPQIFHLKIVEKLTKKKSLDKRAIKEEDLIRRAFKQLKIFYDRKTTLFSTRRQKRVQISH
jgi:hypothetical protein